MRTIDISTTSTFQCEYFQCFTFKRCDKFKLKCTSHLNESFRHFYIHYEDYVKTLKKKNSFESFQRYWGSEICEYRNFLYSAPFVKIVILSKKEYYLFIRESHSCLCLFVKFCCGAHSQRHCAKKKHKQLK